MKSLLITGGTGTFGKKFVRYCIDNQKYDKVIIFSRDEYKQHQFSKALQKELTADEYSKKIRFFLGDVRDKDRLKVAMRNVTHVVHAAALKHVPYCEYNPGEAIKTNVTGTQNVCDAAIECQVENVVVLSTDKAVEPINFYGSSKMLAEKYAIYSNNLAMTQKNSTERITKISCVRYGNVVGSRGSIVEIFRNMMNSNSFSITHPEMTRFWMDINDSVEMVAWGLDNCLGGEVVIPKLKASKVLDIAHTIDDTKEIEIIGIRPGEKLHEQLFTRRENERSYDVGSYYIVLPEKESLEWNKDIITYYESNFKLTKRKKYYSNDVDLQMTNNELMSIVIN
jgi:UDP-N-acetylglucosamine 4,6-dehydratase/5-epimerase